MSGINAEYQKEICQVLTDFHHDAYQVTICDAREWGSKNGVVVLYTREVEGYSSDPDLPKFYLERRCAFVQCSQQRGRLDETVRVVWSCICS